MFKCRLCKSKKYFKFLDLGLQPPSDQFLDEKKVNEPVIYYPLEVYNCENCNFNQLSYVVDPKILYQQNYPYESSLTKAGQKHYFEFAKSIKNEYMLDKDDLVIDIGSNVGTLLSGFKKCGVKVLGVEPAKNISFIALKNKIPTINHFFDSHAVKKILTIAGKPKVITATNVFAHIDNLDLFLKNIIRLLDKNKGVLIIESPHFYHILKNLEYDTIYHEHLSYLTIKPLIPFFSKFNMEIIKVEKKDIHGGSVRIFISYKKKYKIHPSVYKLVKFEEKKKINSKKNLLLFAKKVKQNRLKLVTLLNSLLRSGKKIIALSAPAKGMTLLNYCKIDSDYLDFATEKSKIKQGLFTPGTRLPIFSDSKILKYKPDYALLLAWNFSREIMTNNIQFLKNGGKFIIPIPNAKVVSYKDFDEKNKISNKF
jgi:hypothetical protein